MNDQTLIQKDMSQQVPTRHDNLLHPTPVEIRVALYAVLEEDARNPNTPRIPPHIGAIIREAITRANAGEFA